MNALAGVSARFAIAATLLASAYWVMFGSGHLPWIVSTILHLYAVTTIGVTALLLYQAGGRAVDAIRDGRAPGAARR